MANVKLTTYEIIKEKQPISLEKLHVIVKKKHPGTIIQQVINSIGNINSSTSKLYASVRIVKGDTGGYEIATPYASRKDAETVREKKSSIMSASNIVADLEDELKKSREDLSIALKGKAEFKVKLNELIALLDQ